jgi:hypothetical protein
MTESKKIMMEMRPNVDNITITYGDMSQSEVLGDVSKDPLGNPKRKV